MDHIIVAGSRIYAPVQDVADTLDDELSIASIAGYGSSPVVRAAIEWAKNHDIPARQYPLDPNRANLYQAIQGANTIPILFVCRGVNAKTWTAGMDQITAHLTVSGIAYRLVESPVPGRICKLITDMDDAAREFRSIPDGDPASPFPDERARVRRKRDAFNQANTIGVALTKIVDRLKMKLDDMGGDEDEWIRALRTYEAIERAKADCLGVLFG